MENIKVSVIVAIYNVAPYLNKLITSVINQTHKNLEIILVDDGSPDESGAICDSFAEKDDRIIVLHKPNGGGCDARNKGMERMTGDYFTIMDGDDWIEPDFVEYLLRMAISKDAELTFSDNIFTTRDREQIEHDSIEIWTAEHAVVRMLTSMYIGCWGKIYKTDMVRRNNLKFDVPWCGEGMYFETMSAQYANRIAVCHRKLYNYRLNNSTSDLTTYNVKNGINALWNIKNIGKVSPVQTRKTKYAVKWHIWKNYNFLLQLILATDSVEQYRKEYNACLLNIRTRLPYLVLHRGVFPGRLWGLGAKIGMIKRAWDPIKAAKEQTRREREALKSDLENMQL